MNRWIKFLNQMKTTLVVCGMFILLFLVLSVAFLPLLLVILVKSLSFPLIMASIIWFFLISSIAIGLISYLIDCYF